MDPLDQRQPAVDADLPLINSTDFDFPWVGALWEVFMESEFDGFSPSREYLMSSFGEHPAIPAIPRG